MADGTNRTVFQKGFVVVVQSGCHAERFWNECEVEPAPFQCDRRILEEIGITEIRFAVRVAPHAGEMASRHQNIPGQKHMTICNTRTQITPQDRFLAK